MYFALEFQYLKQLQSAIQNISWNIFIFGKVFWNTCCNPFSFYIFCSYFLQYLLCNMIIATAYYNCKVLRTLSKFAILCYYFLQFLLGTYNLQAKYCKIWVCSLQYFEYLCITLHNCIKYCMTYLQSIAFLWISLHYFAPLHSVLHNIIA